MLIVRSSWIAFPSWLRLCYDGQSYKPIDKNMPPVMIKRKPSQMKNDPPLTEHGDTVAAMIGGAAYDAMIRPVEIYSGPELSCIQTAVAISNCTPLCLVSVEGALSAWKGLVPPTQTFLTQKELDGLEFPISTYYKETIKTSEIPLDDTVMAYQETIRKLHMKIVTEYKPAGVDFVFVTDAAGVLTMRGEKWSSPQEMLKMRATLTPCTTQLIEIDENKKEKLVNMNLLPTDLCKPDPAFYSIPVPDYKDMDCKQHISHLKQKDVQIASLEATVKGLEEQLRQERERQQKANGKTGTKKDVTLSWREKKLNHKMSLHGDETVEDIMMVIEKMWSLKKSSQKPHGQGEWFRQRSGEGMEET